MMTKLPRMFSFIALHTIFKFANKNICQNAHRVKDFCAIATDLDFSMPRIYIKFSENEIN
jgi:hypothetical protein